MQKIGEVSAELSNPKLAMKTINTRKRVRALELLRCESNDQNKEVKTLCQQIDLLEKALVATDLILSQFRLQANLP